MCFLCSIALVLSCIGAKDTSTFQLENLLPDLSKLQQWSKAGTQNFYHGLKLIEFIDGGAELYFAYGFEDACVQNYHSDRGEELSVEIYKMDCSENAFGVYSFDTVGEHPQIDREATYNSGLLKFWKGRFFVRVFSLSQNEQIREDILEFGRSIAGKIKETGNKPMILDRLPKDGINREKVHYLHKKIVLDNLYYLSNENILGLDAETDAVIFDWDRGEEKVKAFIVQYKNRQCAKSAFDSFVNSYLQRIEGSREAEAIEKIGEEGYTGIRLLDRYLILIFEASTSKLCGEMLELIAQNLR